ncbi:MAG: hemolysin family protein [Micrococcales bacterium]|nr:hemolysin family protein [Micrococcales bacterium]
MSTGWALTLAVALMCANAFFVGAEFALMFSRRSSVELAAAAGHRWATTVLWAMEHVPTMLATTQLGVTVCSTSLGLVAEPAVAHQIERPMRALGVGDVATHAVALVVALLVVVMAHVVLGEMVPKNLAVAGPDRVVRWFVPPLVAVARVVRPVVWALLGIANAVLRLVRVEPVDEVASAYTADEVQCIVEHSAAEGTLSDEQGLLSGALEFSDLLANDVMVPLADLVSVPSDVTPAQVEALVACTGFSRFPVTDDDELVGYLHLKDVLYAQGPDRDKPVPRWRVHTMAACAPGDEIEEALAAMQAGAAHLARIDVDGRCVGVVFLEDVLEELVGEVRDAMQRGSSDATG